MKQLFAFLALATLLAPAMLKMHSMADYVLRYEHYVTVLCENRDMPEMKCNGQCQLSKQLQADEKPGEPAPKPSTVDYEIQVFCENTHLEDIGIWKELKSLEGNTDVLALAQYRPGIDTPPPRV